MQSPFASIHRLALQIKRHRTKVRTPIQNFPDLAAAPSPQPRLESKRWLVRCHPPAIGQPMSRVPSARIYGANGEIAAPDLRDPESTMADRCSETSQPQSCPSHPLQACSGSAFVRLAKDPAPCVEHFRQNWKP